MRPEDPDFSANFPPETPPLPPADSAERPVTAEATPDAAPEESLVGEVAGEAMAPEAVEPPALADDPLARAPVATDPVTTDLPTPDLPMPEALATDALATDSNTPGSLPPESLAADDAVVPETPATDDPPPLRADATLEDLRALALGEARPAPAPPPRRPTRPSAPPEDEWAAPERPYQPQELGAVDQLLLVLAEGVALWKKGLRWVRSQLPANLQGQFSDELLTALALGLLVLLLALGNPFGGQGARATEPAPASEPEPTALTGATPETVSETPPEALPEPSPDQSLIADIQARVSRISRSYGAGLIQSVEVDLAGNTLGVNVAETWYGLLPTQQDEIAQDIYAQAQGLQIGTLQLRDPGGEVVARNPVVGTSMVVLHRLRSAEGT
jgi:hypothetical protein